MTQVAPVAVAQAAPSDPVVLGAAAPVASPGKRFRKEKRHDICQPYWDGTNMGREPAYQI